MAMCLLHISAPAFAEEPSAPAAETAASPFAKALSAGELQEARGAQDLGVHLSGAISSQVLSAESLGNRIEADEITTGAVSVANGAFQGFSGIGNFVINTGNNNNVQGAISVAVHLAPTTP